MYANKVRTHIFYHLIQLGTNQYTITVCLDCGPGDGISIQKFDLAVSKKFSNLSRFAPNHFLSFFSKSIQIHLMGMATRLGVNFDGFPKGC